MGETSGFVVARAMSALLSVSSILHAASRAFPYRLPVDL